MYVSRTLSSSLSSFCMRDRRAIYNHVCHASDSFLGLNFAIYTWDVMVLLETAVFRFLLRLIFIFLLF